MGTKHLSIEHYRAIGTLSPGWLRWLAGCPARFGPDDCWIRRDATTGYAFLSVVRPDGTRQLVRSHRVAYTQLVGPLEPGMDVLHTCDRLACVNPAHLFAQRHHSYRTYVRPPFCRRGHPTAADLTYNYLGRPRQCLVCRRIHARIAAALNLAAERAVGIPRAEYRATHRRSAAAAARVLASLGIDPFEVLADVGIDRSTALEYSPALRRVIERTDA